MGGTPRKMGVSERVKTVATSRWSAPFSEILTAAARHLYIQTHAHTLVSIVRRLKCRQVATWRRCADPTGNDVDGFLRDGFVIKLEQNLPETGGKSLTTGQPKLFLCVLVHLDSKLKPIFDILLWPTFWQWWIISGHIWFFTKLDPCRFKILRN
jgi:hypothetical protein